MLLLHCSESEVFVDVPKMSGDEDDEDDKEEEEEEKEEDVDEDTWSFLVLKDFIQFEFLMKG